MEWNPEERAAVAPLIARIEAFPGARHAMPAAPLVLRSSEAPTLEDGLPLPLNSHAVVMRHLFRALSLDEARLRDWQLEHKLIQALVLTTYLGDLIPVTRGLGRDLAGATKAEALRYLDALRAAHVVVKTALGESSGERRGPNQIELAVQAVAGEEWNLAPVTVLSDERFIVQQRLDIVEEYRVHSLEDRVLPDLTFVRYRPFATRIERRVAANRFTQELLDTLPAGLLRDTLYGWDVALDGQRRWHVIEANRAGLHTMFRPGFHCSGFLQTRAFGAPAIALVFAFIDNRYGVPVRIALDADAEAPHARTYWWVAHCRELLALLRDGAGDVRQDAADDDPADRLVLGRLEPADTPEQNFFLWALAECRRSRTA
jgi:hypothetical protein